MTRFQYSSFAVGALSWSGKALAVSSDSRNITVYPDVLRDAQKGAYTTRRMIVPVESGPVVAVVLAGGGTLLSALDAAGKVYWTDMDTMRVRSLQLHLGEDLSTGLALSRSGRFLTAGASNGALKIWDVRDSNPDIPTTISGGHMSAPIVATAISRDGGYAAFGAKNGVIYTRETDRSFDHAGGFRVTAAPSALAFDRRARRLVVGTEAGEISVWEFDPYRSKLCAAWRSDETISLAFTRGGRHVVGLDTSGVVSIWEVRTGQKVQRITPAEKRFTAFALSPDDATIAVGDEGGAIDLVQVSEVTARKWFDLR